MYVVIQYVIGGVTSYDIVHETELFEEETDGMPIWRGSVIGQAEDCRQAGLLADYHADLAEQARREAYARSVVGPSGRMAAYRRALAEAEGIAGVGGMDCFRSWWAKKECHCTRHDGDRFYLCVPDDGYHRRDCPIYGAQQ